MDEQEEDKGRPDLRFSWQKKDYSPGKPRKSWLEATDEEIEQEIQRRKQHKY